jgi:hypothetical protein
MAIRLHKRRQHVAVHLGVIDDQYLRGSIHGFASGVVRILSRQGAKAPSLGIDVISTEVRNLS